MHLPQLDIDFSRVCPKISQIPVVPPISITAKFSRRLLRFGIWWMVVEIGGVHHSGCRPVPQPADR